MPIVLIDDPVPSSRLLEPPVQSRMNHSAAREPIRHALGPVVLQVCENVTPAPRGGGVREARYRARPRFGWIVRSLRFPLRLDAR
jgi:hypothetical protein